MDWVGICLLDSLAVHIKSAKKSGHGAEVTSPKVLSSGKLLSPPSCFACYVLHILVVFHVLRLSVLLTLHFPFSRSLSLSLFVQSVLSLSSRFPLFPISSLLIFTLTLHLTTDVWCTQFFEWMWSGYVAIYPSDHPRKQDSCCTTCLSSALK